MRMQVRLLCSTDKSYLYMSDTFDPTSNNHIINFMVVLFYKILYVANAFWCRHFLHFLDWFRLIKLETGVTLQLQINFIGEDLMPNKKDLSSCHKNKNDISEHAKVFHKYQFITVILYSCIASKRWWNVYMAAKGRYRRLFQNTQK